MATQQTYKVREATPSDLGQILAIEYRCFPDPYPLSLLRKLRSVNPDTFLVAELNSTVVGYAIGAVRWGNVGHILAIGIDSPQKRQGAGSALMKEMFDRFQNRGARTSRLEVRKSNVDAQQFYHKLGFVDRFEVPYYYEDGETALTMEISF